MSGPAAESPTSVAVTLGARTAGLWPLALLIALLVATDRMLIWADGSTFGRLPRSAPLSAYSAFQSGHDPSRPQLVVIGSSRGEEAVDNATLQRALATAALGHQAWNLSIGGGGSPFLLWLALADLTPFARALPDDSLIVYLFSPFELNFLPIQTIGAIPAGGRWLRDSGKGHLAYHLRGYSGWAWFAAAQIQATIMPSLLHRLNVGSATTQPLKTRRFRCNGAGLTDFRILDENARAFESMTRAFRDRLVIAHPPVGPLQETDDREARVFESSRPFIEQIAGAHAARYIPDLVPRALLPPDTFDRDCDHITSQDAKEIVAERIVSLLKK